MKQIIFTELIENGKPVVRLPKANEFIDGGNDSITTAFRDFVDCKVPIYLRTEREVEFVRGEEILLDGVSCNLAYFDENETYWVCSAASGQDKGRVFSYGKGIYTVSHKPVPYVPKAGEFVRVQTLTPDMVIEGKLLEIINGKPTQYKIGCLWTCGEITKLEAE